VIVNCPKDDRDIKNIPKNKISFFILFFFQ
jgi:hypothetical protein